MRHFIIANRDSWISSGSNRTTGVTEKDQNFGADQILELKKVFYDKSFDYPTRVLVQFPLSDLSSSIVNNDSNLGNKHNAGSSSFSLRLYEAEGTTELSTEYKLTAFPVSQSWDEGRGKFGDIPKVTDGVSWENTFNKPNAPSSTSWSLDNGGTTYASGTLTISDGDYANQEVRIGGVDFTFVARPVPVYYNNSSTQIFVSSGSTVNGSAINLRDVINNSSSLHNLNITSSYEAGGKVILSGSSPGSYANMSAGSSSALFNFNSDVSLALEGGVANSNKTSYGGSYVSSSGNVASQSFSYESPDVNMDVTDIVNNWLDGTNNNYGFLLRFSGSQELNNETFGELKYFSSNTHTIYPPKLEVKWEDVTACTGSYTGSLLPMSSSGDVDNYVYPIGLRESYRVNERAKFRFGVRKRYIKKSFSTSLQTVTGSYIGATSGSYSIVDLGSGETIIPFDSTGESYSQLGCDGTYNYFNQWFDGFEPNRYYKILIRVKYDDGQSIIYDDGFEFKVTN